MRGCRGGVCACGGGACMVAGGVCACRGVHGCWGACVVVGGHAWLARACVVGKGMHGCWGSCVVAGGHVWLPGEHAWLLGACMVVGGVCWLPGACMVGGGCAWLWGGACIGYGEIRSMSGRYASYWNAFLFKARLLHFIPSFEFAKVLLCDMEYRTLCHSSKKVRSLQEGCLHRYHCCVQRDFGASRSLLVYFMIDGNGVLPS